MTYLNWVNAVPRHWEAKPLRAVADYVVSNVDRVPADDEVPRPPCNYTDVYNNEFITLGLDFMEATATQAEIARFGLAVDDVGCSGCWPKSAARSSPALSPAACLPKLRVLRAQARFRND